MNRKIIALVLSTLGLLNISNLMAEETVFVYLIDPKDQETIQKFKKDGVASPLDIPDLPTTTSTKTNETAMTNSPADIAKAKKTLDDLIDGLSKKPPLTKSQERVIKKVTADQIEFLHRLDEFVKADFDEKDDQAKPGFNQIRDRIVGLVFDAQTEKHFYERLFLINQSWLEHSSEVARYNSLDRALRDRSLAIEERSRRYRQIITGVAAVGGAVAGGFISYKAAQKILPVVATDQGFSQIVRWAGRGTIVFIGAGVGAIAGAELGFLGSEYLFSRRDYVNPIDGDEDLRDILQVIDTL